MAAPAITRLVEPLICYRIGDPAGEFPIYDPGGSTKYPARWREAGTPVIYSSVHYSTAMLEVLANLDRGAPMPARQHFISITVPAGTSCERVDGDQLPGWDRQKPDVSRAFGTRWVAEARSAILLVPSYVARIERNVVINPAHPQATAITVGAPQPVWWDERLFA